MGIADREPKVKRRRAPNLLPYIITDVWTFYRNSFDCLRFLSWAGVASFCQDCQRIWQCF